MIRIDNCDNTVCYIKTKGGNSKVEAHVSVDNSDSNGVKGFELNDEYYYQLVPRKGKERDVLFVSGESGSGKSYFCKNYILEYKKLFPKNPLYLISYLDDDETLDSIPGLQRLEVFTPEFMSEIDDISIDEFKDALVIFDDVDSIPEKKTKIKLYGLLNKFLRLGRHSNTTILFAGHEVMAGNETKTILNESSHIVYFPITIGDGKLERLLKVYLGLGKDQIQRIRDIKDSRSICIIKGYPKVIVSEHKMFHF